MTSVFEDLGLARSVLISNVWLLRSEGHTLLVDTGHSLERWQLVRSLRRVGVSQAGDLTAILLTHRHSDHAGNAAWLRDHFRCPVLCHADDARVLRGDCSCEKLGGRGHGWPWDEALCRIEDRFPARCPVDEVFEEGAVGWGLTAVPVPGHTEGSSLLLHEASGVLFTGDSLLTGIPPWRFFEKRRLAVRAYSADVDASRAATRRAIASLPTISAIAAGHGPCVTQDADQKLRMLG